MFLFLLCSFLTGCGGPNKEGLSHLFPKQIEVQSQPLEIRSDDILSPLYLISVENYLICANFRTDKCIRIYDLETGMIVNDIVTVGRGPNELLNVSSMSFTNGQLVVHSSNSDRTLVIPYGELLKTHPKMTVVDGIEDCFRMLPIAYDQYILAGCADGNLLELADAEGDFISTFDVYPNDGDRGYSGNNRLIYQGHLVASPNGKHFAFATSSGVIFKFGEVQSKGSVNKTKEYIIAQPEYTLDSNPDNDRYSIIWNESCLAGALSLAASSKYCFLLQEENKLKADRNWRLSTVLVFDWRGKPIAKFHLDKPLEAIAYNERENVLIGLTLNEHLQPLFVSYQLSDLEA